MDDENLFIYLKDKRIETIKFECYKGYYFICCKIENYNITLTNTISIKKDSIFPLYYDSTKYYTINDFEYTSITINQNIYIDKENIIY